MAFDLPAGDYLMRCVVREPGGIIGSADRRFTVRALGGYEVAASDLLLYSARRSVARARAGYTGGLLTGSTRLYAPSVDKLQSVTARLELTPNDDTPDPGAVRRVIDGTLGDVLVGSGAAMRDVMFAVPLEKLAAGSYVAHAIIRVDGELVADLRRPVDVLDGPPRHCRQRRTSAAQGRARRRDRRTLVRDAASLRTDLEKARSKRTVQCFAVSPSGCRRRAIANACAAWLDGTRRLLGAASSRSASRETRGSRSCSGGRASAPGIGRGGDGVPQRRARSENGAAHLALAQTYLDLGNPALAAQALEAGLRAIPGSIELEDGCWTGRK